MNTRRLTAAILSILGAWTLAAGCRHGDTEPGGGGAVLPGPSVAGRRAPMPLPRTIHAVWVARYHFHTPDDVRTIIANCAALRCNTILWQVRGEGTVCYPSRIEPWGREFGYRDPGFDPLALAIEEAHKRGLRVEAWFNVMAGWHGPSVPPIPGQLYNAHPDWFLHDAAGRIEPLRDFYSILNPCWPEVRGHIVSLIDELVSRYDLDGVHLDYVRYAWDLLPKAKQNYPRDERTLALYWRETGRRPDDDANAWNHWRANQVTRIVVETRQLINRRRPGATLTAAVRPDPVEAYSGYLQNGVAWLRSGIVDALLPMAYTTKIKEFDENISRYRQLARGQRIVPGVGLYMHKSEEPLREQLRLCRTWGGDYALFSYESLFPTETNRKPPGDEQRLRELRYGVLTETAAY
jgi:uncharacterized lipoprotein YddW (UPF0748 family)